MNQPKPDRIRETANQSTVINENLEQKYNNIFQLLHQLFPDLKKQEVSIHISKTPEFDSARKIVWISEPVMTAEWFITTSHEIGHYYLNQDAQYSRIHSLQDQIDLELNDKLASGKLIDVDTKYLDPRIEELTNLLVENEYTAWEFAITSLKKHYRTIKKFLGKDLSYTDLTSLAVFIEDHLLSFLHRQLSIYSNKDNGDALYSIFYDRFFKDRLSTLGLSIIRLRLN